MTTCVHTQWQPSYGLIFGHLTAQAFFEELCLPDPLMNVLKYRLPNTTAVPSLPVTLLVSGAHDSLLIVCRMEQAGHDVICQAHLNG